MVFTTNEAAVENASKSARAHGSQQDQIHAYGKSVDSVFENRGNPVDVVNHLDSGGTKRRHGRFMAPQHPRR